MQRKSDKVCLCDNPVLCRGLTAGFLMMEDPRGGFARLPRFEADPPSLYYVQRNQQRSSYLRCLLPNNVIGQNTPTSRYVALHHFHPRVIDEMDTMGKKTVPKTLAKEEMIQLGIKLKERDQVLDEDGNATGEYIFCPNYRISKAKKDLKRLLLICLELNNVKKTRRSSKCKVGVLSVDDKIEPCLVPRAETTDDSESDEESVGSNYLPLRLTKEVQPWLQHA